jgi:predicted  nucleic acid-binding Zn ribbon protein
MFSVKISFPKENGETELGDAAYDALSSWYKNGQIVGNFWTIADSGSSSDAYVLLPERDSLAARYDNSYAEHALAALPGPHGVTILGRAPNRDSCCSCPARSAMLLFTHYMTDNPPARCLDCFRPIPLYTLPHVHDADHGVLIQWAADYRACDTLQMHCTTGERFGEQQLLRHDSSLSRNGRALCAKLEELTGTPTYYYLHKTRSRGRKSEMRRRCPSCGEDWRLARRLHLFDFQCPSCRLVSAIAADAS